MYPSPDIPNANPDGPRRVLVVDDEPTLRLGFAYALNNGETRVDTANNGYEALDKIRNESFDAMLLDLRMPDIDGLAVIRQLRRDGDQIPVILCSAFVTLESAVTAMRHGVVDFLIKPVRPVELREAVAALFRTPGNPLERSLQAGRACEFGTALELIRALPEPSTREKLWLTIFEILAGPDGAPPAGATLPPDTLEGIAFQSREQ